MARQNSRVSRSQHGAGAARWAGRRSRAVFTIRARRRDLARLRAEAGALAGPADHAATVPCADCAGSGQVGHSRCPTCGGNGWVAKHQGGPP
jgi:RecJ-like exonuclease